MIFHMLLIFSRSPAFIIQSYLAGHFDFQSRLMLVPIMLLKLPIMLWSDAPEFYP